MALIKCNECGKEISDKATNCLNCGCPVDAIKNENVEEISKKFVKHKGDGIGIIAIIIMLFGFILLFGNIIIGFIIIVIGLIYLFGNTKKIRSFNDFKKTDEYIEYSKLKIENQRRNTELYNVTSKKAKAKNRIIENKENGVACCPKCGSTSLSAHKKGFGIGKAVIGGALTGGIGLIAGNIGAKKIRVTCLNCGKQFWAGK